MHQTVSCPAADRLKIEIDIEKIHRDLFNAYVHTYVCIKRSTSVVYCMTSGKYVIVIKFGQKQA